jgi:drug efflux transport system permease protein
MLAIAAYMVGVIHPAASIVKEKETGTIEQLVVTPLHKGEIVLAKTLPTLVVGLLGFGPGLLVARAFGVPFRGDPFTFVIVSAVFLASAAATGVLIASLTRTLQQALLVSFFVLFPVLFLSGTMTPIETMPRLVELATRLSPLRYYMDALLAIFMKGVGLSGLWRHLAWMAGLGTGLMAAGIVLFRRTA